MSTVPGERRFTGTPADTLARLVALFPNGPLHPARPMKLGIHKDLAAHLAPLHYKDRRAIGAALHRLVMSTPYLRLLAAPGAVRVGVDGQPHEPVSTQHAQAAADEIKRRNTRPAPAAREGVQLEVQLREHEVEPPPTVAPSGRPILRLKK